MHVEHMTTFDIQLTTVIMKFAQQFDMWPGIVLMDDQTRFI